jgi:hypothetical protein
LGALAPYQCLLVSAIQARLVASTLGLVLLLEVLEEMLLYLLVEVTPLVVVTLASLLGAQFLEEAGLYNFRQLTVVLLV